MEDFYILRHYKGLCYSRSTSLISRTAPFEDRHCHDRHELIYILQGSGKYIVEGMEYPLHPHALYFMRPYEYHCAFPSPEGAYERIVLRFDEALLPATVRRIPLLHGMSGNYFSTVSQGAPLRAAFETLGGTRALLQDGHEEDAEALLHATLAQIILLLSVKSPEDPLSETSATVRRIIEHLNAHLCEELSLDALAKEFFISKYHLCRLFREQTGASILTYFNAKRLALAKQLIADGENATAVAVQLGFHDYSTFYRAYRKQMGESPVRRLK
ncbi:MAG: helix-turn-helix domain-containing protein [Ruminococcaceae bacterium]|nr:helix-turn-helix domain-containing protein [Oscillospiraceae bacterium]